MEPGSTPIYMLYYQVIGFFIALCICALFSFLETSVTALRLFILKEIASTTGKYRKLFTTLEQHPHEVLVTMLIANSFANVTAAALITNIADIIFGYFNISGGLSFSLGVGIGTIIILIFGEVIPKNIAKIYGERFFQSTLWIINIVYYLLYPFVKLLISLSDTVIQKLGGTAEAQDSVASEKEIQFMIDYIYQKGLMEKEKTEMLRSVFQLGQKTVKEIMIPTTDVVIVNASLSIKEALDTFTEYQYSRIPVFEDKQENVIGIVLQKDIFILLANNQNKKIKELVRPIMFVPESMKINQLLREFRPHGQHMAMVLNEFGSITGLVTLEDVIEEIVGEISDEYEAMAEKVIRLENNNLLVDASIDLDEIQELINITFEENSAITLGGFLTEQLQHLPKKGERVSYKNYCFQVQKASKKRVQQILIFQENSTDF